MNATAGRPPRVLLIYMASTGAGHRRAAEAIEKALTAAGAETKLINIVDCMNESLHRLYQTIRRRILEAAPHVFGQLYDWYDANSEKNVASLFDRLLSALERQSLRRLLDYLRESEHDVVIHTHFFSAELAAYLRRRGEVDFPHLTVTTDFFSHSMWLHQPCERIFVATEDAELHLRHLGASAEQIEQSGIPVDAEFESLRLEPEAHASETEARLRGFEGGERPPRVTFMATGLSPEVARIAQDSLLSVERPLHIRTLVGGDDARRVAVEAMAVPGRHRAHVLGPTDQVPRILADSDLLAGKAGGLTSAEAMAVGCPMAILRPRPDQEDQNTDLLLERGAAVRVFRPPLLGPKVAGVFASPDTFRSLRRGAYQLGRPGAARRIAEVALQAARGELRASHAAEEVRRPRSSSRSQRGGSPRPGGGG